MSINNEVNIFPGFTALHYSFYIEGLLRVKETQNIHFGNSDFPLRMISYLAFEYKGKRYLIDAMDTSHIDEPALQWCDLCGKVNYSKDEIIFVPDPNVEDAFIEPVLDLIKNNALRESLKHAARRKVEQYYSQEVVFDQLREFYRRQLTKVF